MFGKGCENPSLSAEHKQNNTEIPNNQQVRDFSFIQNPTK